MVEVTVDSLYQCFDVISNVNATESEKLKSFQGILSGCKGGPNEKRLASQFIGRFFKSFQSEKDKSFNCLLDLCEDEDIKTRIQAVRDFQQICKSEPAFIPRVSDVMSQLLVTEDSTEFSVISSVLKSLLDTDPNGTLVGVFNQILLSKSEVHRQNLITFLISSLKTIPEEKMTSELDEFIVEQSNKLLNSSSPTEFVNVTALMSSLKSMSTLLGRQKLVNMITEKILVFNPQNIQSIEFIQNAGKQIIRLLSKNVSAAQFLNYMLISVVPSVLTIENPFQQRRLLQILTNLSSHPGDAFTSIPVNDQVRLLQPLYNSLLKSLPEPYDISGGEVPSNISLPAFTVECIFYTLLNLLKFCPTFLCSSVQDGNEKASQEGVNRLQALRQKAQYAARLIQSHKPSIVTELQAAFQADGGCSVKTAEEVRRALGNIEKMVRCVFRSKIEADCTHDIILSWIEPPPVKPKPTNTALPGVKRIAQQQSPLGSGNKQRRFQPGRRGPGFRGRYRRF